MRSSFAWLDLINNADVFRHIKRLRDSRIAFWILMVGLQLAGCEWAPGPEIGIKLKERTSPERETLGEHYDLKKHQECVAKDPINSQCDKYRLVRVESPEYWPYADVPPMKWPEPPQRAQFRRGMSGDDYFKELCEKEAGEFIYRTVEDVEGLYMIRPRMKQESYASYDRYVLEDPYGEAGGDDWPRAPWAFVGITDKALHKPQSQSYSFYKYLYLETAIVSADIPQHRRYIFDPSVFAASPHWAKTQVFHGGTGETRSIKRGFRKSVLSRFGFTWRDVRRPFDREFGIGGGEVALVDLRTNEVLGVRRGFKRGVDVKGASYDFVWSGAMCPRYAHLPGYRNRDRDGDSVLWFLTKVAKPRSGYVHEFKEGE